MKTSPLPVPPETDAFPRVALFLSDPALRQELESILRDHYSSLMLITDKAKLAEFSVPLIVLVETIRDAAEIRALPPVEGTQVLLVSRDGDSEIVSAAFDAGADDYVAYPFEPPAVIAKVEKYLEVFRA